MDLLKYGIKIFCLYLIKILNKYIAYNIKYIFYNIENTYSCWIYIIILKWKDR